MSIAKYSVDLSTTWKISRKLFSCYTNYGGDDLGQFLRGTEGLKAIQIENEGGEDKNPGVSTLTIELPVEAARGAAGYDPEMHF